MWPVCGPLSTVAVLIMACHLRYIRSRFANDWATMFERDQADEIDADRLSVTELLRTTVMLGRHEIAEARRALLSADDLLRRLAHDLVS